MTDKSDEHSTSIILDVDSDDEDTDDSASQSHDPNFMPEESEMTNKRKY